ncbi:hypothetical protein [Rubripirellula reticaptiva]|uniref:Uncharacterized protein n=1 Tax=Rubripirellula reticaptiva TaxID=2528013 RepID=A0A5C6ELT1_9BACT|nr:hypothetical protein [Rubripirellula reticaptiva]TWU49445.1 hypothetical protein Poly59_40600 [Rubripirellula reticaptiva]
MTDPYKKLQQDEHKSVPEADTPDLAPPLDNVTRPAETPTLPDDGGIGWSIGGARQHRLSITFRLRFHLDKDSATIPSFSASDNQNDALYPTVSNILGTAVDRLVSRLVADELDFLRASEFDILVAAGTIVKDLETALPRCLRLLVSHRECRGLIVGSSQQGLYTDHETGDEEHQEKAGGGGHLLSDNGHGILQRKLPKEPPKGQVGERRLDKIREVKRSFAELSFSERDDVEQEAVINLAAESLSLIPVDRIPQIFERVDLPEPKRRVIHDATAQGETPPVPLERMTGKELVDALLSEPFGMTLRDIGSEIGKHHSIPGDISSGKTKQPREPVMQALRELFRRKS